MDVSIINASFRLEQRDSGVEWKILLDSYVYQILSINRRSLRAFAYAHLVEMGYSPPISTGMER